MVCGFNSFLHVALILLIKNDQRMNMTKGFSIVALHNSKDEKNIGSALRACFCYNAKALIVSGKRYKVSCTDTPKAYRHLPLIQTDNILGCIPYDCVPVAVELTDNATNIIDYKHPARAFYIFGAEDGDVPNSILEKCRDVIYIPTNRCMNLAATVNVVLYDRLAKEGK